VRAALDGVGVLFEWEGYVRPLIADQRNFYKVEKWTRDGMQVDRLLYAGNNLTKERDIFAEAVKHRPRIRLTIRQRTRVLSRWPQVTLIE
jgi:hypothetical protein